MLLFDFFFILISFDNISNTLFPRVKLNCCFDKMSVILVVKFTCKILSPSIETCSGKCGEHFIVSSCFVSFNGYINNYVN